MLFMLFDSISSIRSDCGGSHATIAITTAEATSVVRAGVIAVAIAVAIALAELSLYCSCS